MAGDGTNRPVDIPSALEARAARLIATVPAAFFQPRSSDQIRRRLDQESSMLSELPQNLTFANPVLLEQRLAKSPVLPIFPVVRTQEVKIPDSVQLKATLETTIKSRSQSTDNVNSAEKAVTALGEILTPDRKIILDQFEPNMQPLSPSDLARHPEAGGDRFFYIRAVYPFYSELRREWRKLMKEKYGEEMFTKVYEQANLLKGNRLTEIIAHLENLITVFGKGHQTPFGLRGGLNIPEISDKLEPVHAQTEVALESYWFLPLDDKIKAVMKCEDAAVRTLNILGSELGVTQTNPVKIT